MLAVAVPIALGAAGCSAPGGDPPPPAPPTTSPTPGSPDDPIRCGIDLPVPNPAAPPYAGEGPHLAVAGVRLDLNVTAELTADEFSTHSLPDEWGAYDAEHDEDAARAQLFVCLAGVHQRGTTPIGTCQWDEASSQVYPGTYTIEVYEARTGHRPAVLTITSDLGADAPCPSSIYVRRGYGAPDIAQGFKDETLAAALAPFVMKDAG